MNKGRIVRGDDDGEFNIRGKDDKDVKVISFIGLSMWLGQS